jgi:Spy/CpxP family protein refolding chaperone
MSMRLRSIAVGAMIAVLLVPLASVAQTPNRRGDDRAQLEQRVRAQMGRVTRERLGLSEEQATRLSAVVDDFEGQRRELFQLEQATRRRVEALLLEGGNDQDEARELISRMWELREQEAELFRTEQEALLDVLTPVQLLRLQELRQDLGRRIRALGGRNGQPGAGSGQGPIRGGRIGGGPGQGRGAPPRGAPGR